jgi:hypothetical protein
MEVFDIRGMLQEWFPGIGRTVIPENDLAPPCLHLNGPVHESDQGVMAELFTDTPLTLCHKLRPLEIILDGQTHFPGTLQY